MNFSNRKSLSSVGSDTCYSAVTALFPLESAAKLEQLYVAFCFISVACLLLEIGLDKDHPFICNSITSFAKFNFRLIRTLSHLKYAQFNFLLV